MEPLAWLPRLDPVWITSPGPAATIQGKEAGPARRTLDGTAHSVNGRFCHRLAVAALSPFPSLRPSPTSHSHLARPSQQQPKVWIGMPLQMAHMFRVCDGNQPLLAYAHVHIPGSAAASRFGPQQGRPREYCGKWHEPLRAPHLEAPQATSRMHADARCELRSGLCARPITPSESTRWRNAGSRGMGSRLTCGVQCAVSAAH